MCPRFTTGLIWLGAELLGDGMRDDDTVSKPITSAISLMFCPSVCLSAFAQHEAATVALFIYFNLLPLTHMFHKGL